MYEQDFFVRRGRIARTEANEKKMGAYYTDVSHAEDIGKMFRFPDGDVCILEPSIGDGSAVEALTRASEYPNRKIFGVELNEAVAKEVGEKPWMEDCIQADFLSGVKISRNVFSFCFGNPPYIADRAANEEAKPLEVSFLERVTENYLMRGGILVWVIREEMWKQSFKYLFNHYEILEVYRFRPEEYQKWKQIVFVGRKIPTQVHLASEIEEAKERYASLEELPETPVRIHEVLPSRPEQVVYFGSKIFPAEKAFAFLSDRRKSTELEQMDVFQSNAMSQDVFSASSFENPPIPLKKDSLYMAAMTGCGQGLAGVPGKDLHLQRGNADVVEEVRTEQDEEGNSISYVTSRTAVSMKIIETDGTIHTLD